MTLSPEAAAVLRQALHEAHYQVRRTGNTITAYAVLAETVDALLAPLPADEFAAHVAKYRRPAGEDGPAF